MTVHLQSATPTAITAKTITTTEKTENLVLCPYPVRELVKTNRPRERFFRSQHSKQAAYPGQETNWTGPSPTKRHPKQYNRECPGCSPTFKLEMPRLHYEAAIDKSETTKTILPPIPEVVWQQPPETSVETSKLVIIDNDPNNETTQNAQTPNSGQRIDVKSLT